jgi:excisionase family DNA binding protein
MAAGGCAGAGDVKPSQLLSWRGDKGILHTILVRKGHISFSRTRGLNLYRPNDQEVLLTPAEVASLFRVDPKTVTRWAKAGKLTAIRTLGGHRRYRQSEVQALLKTVPQRGV